MERWNTRWRCVGATLAACALAAPLAASASAAAPPDGRGYELVSPAAKGGGDVMADAQRTRAASADSGGLPMAVTFASLTGFGDVRGFGIATEYLSVRDGQAGTQGWSTHGITPPQEPMTLLAGFNNLEPGYRGDFSEDLTVGVFGALSPVTDDDNVADAPNLYRRDDLRTAGTGSYDLLSACPGCAGPLAPNINKPFYAGSSADFTTAVFESRTALTSDASGSRVKLYASDTDGVRLVGRIPGSGVSCDDAGGPACVVPNADALAGHGATPERDTPRIVSTDGVRITFTVLQSGDCSGFPCGQLYQRVGPDATVHVSASEKTIPDAPQKATYWTASSDGTKVFFTTTEQLVDSDTDLASDLYSWDGTAPVGSRLTRLSVDGEPADGTGADVLGALGASDDGETVYFFSFASQLAPGGPPVLDQALYAWRNGTLRFVGEISRGDASSLNLPGIWRFGSNSARVTPDGSHLLFAATSGAGLTGYDHGSTCGIGGGSPCQELYVYDADDGELACASCNPSGATATADASPNARVATGAAATSWHLSHALSDDGRRVFFSSAEALVEDDVNGRSDAYVYDVPTRQVSLLSSGTHPTNSYFMDASANGDDAFFVTRERLVGWDVDQSLDLYDARVGGGFPEPVAGPPACTGEACQPAPAATPGAAAAGTSAFRGAGNVRASSTSKPKAKSKRQRAKQARKRMRARCKRRGGQLRRVNGKVRCVGLRRRAGKRSRAGAGRAHRAHDLRRRQ